MEQDEPLEEAFWAVARRLRHQSRDALAPWEVTPSQSRAVGVLAKFGTMRLSELALHLRIAPRSATEVVDDLEQAGLVERAPDPGDRRATLVELTPRGVEVAGAIRKARAAEAQSYFRVLSEADRAELSRLLRALRDQ